MTEAIDKKLIGTIDMTPAGLTTPEGVKRVNEAVEAHQNAMVNVANTVSQFLDVWGSEIEWFAREHHDQDFREGLKELRETIGQRREAQNELLKAIAGRA